VLLNFSPDHLDRHSSVQEYAEAKSRIFSNQDTTDWAVLNADDIETISLADGGRARRVLFSLAADPAADIVLAGDTIVRRTRTGEEPLVPVSSIKLLGRHLLADVLAAAAVSSLVGVAADAMTRAVEGFTGLEHVLEPVAEVGGVRFVNDSKATNVDAARRAIESFDDGLVVVMGGRFKGGDLHELVEPLAARRATIVAIGEARALIREVLGGTRAIHDADDMSAAVRTAFALASPGDTVVLAPACASFDMFRDYAERGRVFKQEVRRLGEEWNLTREQ
jgi:UDP-N-acetylmuramoylalanine--D-glutamate ligase